MEHRQSRKITKGTNREIRMSYVLLFHLFSFIFTYFVFLTRFLFVFCRIEHEDKMDIYDFGVILLEMLMGLQIKTRSELNALRNHV